MSQPGSTLGPWHVAGGALALAAVVLSRGPARGAGAALFAAAAFTAAAAAAARAAAAAAAASPLPALAYAPFSAADASPDAVLCVDCTHPRAASLTHHRSGATPPELRTGDTSTALVLAAVAARHALLGAPHTLVSANHFDADGLGAVFAAAFPAEALARRALLEACASLGDFRALDLATALGRAALRWNVWVNAVERARFWRPFERGARDEAADASDKYAFFLPRCAAALDLAAAAEAGDAAAAAALRADAPADFDAEHARVLADCAALAASGSAARLDALGLCIVTCPRPLHYYALFQPARGLDAVLSLAGRRYELEQRYTGYVHLASRASLPRLSLQPLARALSAAEAAAGGAGAWVADPFTEAGPLLRLQAAGAPRLSKAQRYGHPCEREGAESALEPDAFVRACVSYCEFGLRGTAPRARWGWGELHERNGGIDWQAWREGVLPAALAGGEGGAQWQP